MVFSLRPSSLLTVTEVGGPLMSPPSVCQMSDAPLFDRMEFAFPETEGKVFPCRLHWFVDVHTYQFAPASAVVKMNVAPT